MAHKHKWRPADSEQIVPGWPRCSICNIPASSVGEAFKGLCEEVGLLEGVVEAGKHLRKASPSSSFWQVKDHDKSWIWCWNELSDTAQQRVKQANIRFDNALAKLENPDAST